MALAEKALRAAAEIRPDDAEVLVGLVRVSVIRTDPSGALKLLDAAPSGNAGIARLRRAVRRHFNLQTETEEPDVPEAEPRDGFEWYVAGVCAMLDCRDLGRSEFAEAVRCFTRAIERSDRGAKAIYHFERAHAAGHAGDVAVAEESAASIAELWPDSESGALLRAMALQGSGQHASAVPILKSLLGRNQANVPALRALSRSLIGLGHRQEAMEAVLKLLHREPADVASHAKLVDLLVDDGQKGEATQRLSGLLRKSETSATFAGTDTIGPLLRRGERGVVEGALAIAVAAEPGSPIVRWNAAEFARTEGRLADARTQVELGLGFGRRASLVGLLSLLCTEEGENDRALQLASEASALDPENPFLRERLSRALLNTGDLDAARSEAKVVARMLPYWDGTFGLLGSIEASAKDWNAAARAFRRQAELDPRTGLNWFNLAIAELNAGEFLAAEAAARQAIAAEPRDFSSHAALAKALTSQARAAEAIVAFERVRSFASKNELAKLDRFLEVTRKQAAFEARVDEMLAAGCERLSWEQMDQLANVLSTRGRHLALARAWRSWVGQNGERLKESTQGERPRAAKAALQASLGYGTEGETLDASARREWGELARRWLRFLARQQLQAHYRHHAGAECRDFRREVAHGGTTSSPLLIETIVGTVTSPSMSVERAELRRRVELALLAMTPADREILILRQFEGLTNQEAALELNLTESAAEKRYLRALQRLGESLKI